MNRRNPAPLFAAMLLIALILNACVPPAGEVEAARAPFDPDLYGWRTASWTPFTVSDSISGFARGTVEGRDRYVAVSRSGVIGWSDDGDIWWKAAPAPADDGETPVNPFDASFNAAAFGNGMFVAVGNGGKIAYSGDGIQWTAGGHTGGITGFGTENINGIAFGNGTFVAVGGNGNIACSVDEKSWDGGAVAGFGGAALNAVAFGNGRFYVVGNGGNRGWSATPAVLNSWNPKPPAFPCYTNDIRALAVGRYGGGAGIIVAFNEWDGRRIAVSVGDDFNDWDADINAGQFGNNAINGVAFGGGNFVAAGQSAMIGWWPGGEPSNDAQRYWRALSFREFQWWEITALAALKDRFFVGGIGGKIGYSK